MFSTPGSIHAFERWAPTRARVRSLRRRGGCPPSPGSRSRRRRRKPASPGPLVVRARPGAYHRLLWASVLEEDRGRDREDAEARSSLDVLVDVQLREGDSALVLPLQFREDGFDGATGPAPRGPEVDDDGLARLEHVPLEALVGDLVHG